MHAVAFASARQTCKNCNSATTRTAIAKKIGSAMNTGKSLLLMTSGRWLIALYFLVPGILKFVAFPMHVDLMTLHKVPYPVPLLIIAGIAQIIGALLLISNRFVRFSALGLAVYIVLINVLLHDFWNFDGVTASHEIQNFIKNLGIFAGLLILAGAASDRPLNIKEIFASDSLVAKRLS